MDLGGINARGLPIYVEGILITDVGPAPHRRCARPGDGQDALDVPGAEDAAAEYSMRANHGKGVAYAEINGRGVVIIVTPGFFLHALDAKTGKPLENWGEGVPLPGFPKTGSVDMLKDLITDWEPWTKSEQKYDPTTAFRSRSATSPTRRRRSW